MFIGNYGNKYMLLQFLTSYYLQTLTFIYLIMRGVNENRREIIARPFCFNPRTYTRCDDVAGSNKFVYFVVSIHAPTRGATLTYTNG